MHPLVSRLLGPVAASRLINVSGGGAYEEVFNRAITGSSGSWQNYTFRSAINRIFMPASASKFQLGFTLNGGDGTQVSEVWVGKGSGLVFNSAPTQVFCGGNPGAIFTSAGITTSDEVTLDYDGDGNLIVSCYIPSTAGSNNRLGGTNATAGAAFYYTTGNVADDVGGTRNANGSGSYALSVVDAFVTNTWTERIKPAGVIGSSGWNNYTLRTRFEVGQFPSSGFSDFRIGFINSAPDVFIGNAVSTAGSFAFDGTPTRLQFNGANASPTNQIEVHMTDTAALSILDLSKPVLVSQYNTSGSIFILDPTPSGMSSKYAGGNVASQISESGFGAFGSAYTGPVVIDVK